MALFSRLAILVVCGALFVAITVSPAVASPEVSVDASEKKIVMPTDPAADPEATDAASHGESMNGVAEVAPGEGDADADAGADADEGEKMDLKPIAETLAADPDFSILLAAVSVAADDTGKPLAEDIAAEGPFTVFAPTDAAFTAFLAETGKTPEEVLADPNLRDIVANHVLTGKYTAADVLALELPVEVETLGGAKLKVDKTMDGDVMVGGVKVVKPDIMTSNGVVHGVDGVITDPSQGGT